VVIAVPIAALAPALALDGAPDLVPNLPAYI
jgi:hypothetical protein